MNEQMYAGYPSVVMRSAPGSGKPVQQLLWGDWLRVLGAAQDGFIQVHCRGETGWVGASEVQPERLLELTLVDVGQGDGCILTTPRDRQLLIDAGASDNMYRYLRWRFNDFKSQLTFEHAVITHSDLDHYGGFEQLLERPTISIEHLHHNGLVERKEAGKTSIGAVQTRGGRRYVTGLIRDHQQLSQLLADPEKRARRRYAQLLWHGLTNGRVGEIRMLSANDRFLPGYDDGQLLSIHVISPVTEENDAGKAWLPWFGSLAKTKNGNSIVLLVRYGDVRLLLGGDLNSAAEARLLQHYAGRAVVALNGDVDSVALADARRELHADVVKSCHHGSADFLDAFLEATNPAATLVSSGDDEGYAHPRADALGAIGRTSAGIRPLIFSTELGRSSPEFRQRPAQLKNRLETERRRVRAAVRPEAEAAATERFKEVRHQLERAVAVYGAIQVRTDGQRVVIAQKIERPVSKGNKWDLYALERSNGILAYRRS